MDDALGSGRRSHLPVASVIGVGTKLREYEIVAPLRVGGMATLFLGRRQGAAGFAKLVAIKVVHPHLAREAQFGQMFVDEALISARIEHPNVVHVTELGEQAGVYLLVMDHVHGASLSQLLAGLSKRGRRLSPELAVHIAVRVAEGLHAAHETLGDDRQPLHVVHRNISPQNVLLSARGHVKLIDFGIAKARGRVQQTTSSSLKGKIRYVAPEQAFGRPGGQGIHTPSSKSASPLQSSLMPPLHVSLVSGLMSTAVPLQSPPQLSGPLQHSVDTNVSPSPSAPKVAVLQSSPSHTSVFVG
jgi:serine/threonine protein kinase